MANDEFAAVLAAHFEVYAALELQDVYKLLYQRVFGHEHLIGNPRAAKEELYLEVVRLPVLPVSVPLIDPLSSRLCRINLQPYIQSNGDIATLWQMFRQTTREYQPGTVSDLEYYWRIFLTSPWAERFPSPVQVQFWQQMATVGFAPVHHSRGYTSVYTPHYRVVLRSLCKALW